MNEKQQSMEKKMSKTKEDKESSPSTDQNETEHIVLTNPDLKIAQLCFLVNRMDLDPKIKSDKWKQLLEMIKEKEMAPYYEFVCQELGTPVDSKLLAELKEKNLKKIENFEKEIKDAEENLGESEVRQAWLRKSEYLSQIGDKDAAVTAFRQTYEKTVGLGYRIDLVFNLIRLGLFFMDHQLITANMSKAKDLMEMGGDWERKNRLRSYEGLYKMAIRDFKAAAKLFLEAVPTFGSYELMSYDQLIFYTVVVCMLDLDRPDLRSEVIKCSEIQEKLMGGGGEGQLVLVKQFLDAMYERQYDQFFACLARMEERHFKSDRYLQPHYNFYSRFMRQKAFEQFLTPYKTVKLDAMAEDFGVSREYIDGQLHALIAAGSLHCRIDAVRGLIEMNHPDSKNDLYKTVIRDGDILLSRVQKLARVINQ